MHIAVDFDGTLFTENNYPDIGLPIFPTIEKIKQLKEQGHKLILWTCRQGENLQNAIDACKKVGLEFDFINENDPERVKMFQNDCRKIGAHIYIDDRAIRPNEIDLLINEPAELLKDKNY